MDICVLLGFVRETQISAVITYYLAFDKKPALAFSLLLAMSLSGLNNVSVLLYSSTAKKKQRHFDDRKW